MARAHWLERLALWLAPVVLLAGVGYFAYHALQGRYGLVARDEAERRIARLTNELARMDRLINERETQVRGLSEQTLDLDLLEERLRVTLGYMRPGEVLIPLQASAPATPADP